MATRKSKTQKAKEAELAAELVAEEKRRLTGGSDESSLPDSQGSEPKAFLRKGERITVHGITYRVRGTNPQAKEVLLREVKPEESVLGTNVKIL